MRLRLCDRGVAALDPATGKWLSLDGPTDIVSILGLSRSERETLLANAKKGAGPVEKAVPIKATSLRDGALFAKHLKQAIKGFGPVALANGHALQMFFGQIVAKSLRLPRGLNPMARKPAYYVGNVRTMIPDGAEARWPSHCAWLDYELEVALVVGASLGFRPSVDEIEKSILEHGAFVLINDFSARDTQADELTSVGFGFVKSKSFCTAVASEVVTADELWGFGDTGQLFSLDCQVTVNGEIWGRGTTAERRVCSLAEYVRFAALDEGLGPGEVLGLGTVPNCCGLECGKWLKPGDVVTLDCQRLGSLTNTVGQVPPDAVNFKDYGDDDVSFASRLRIAVKLLVFAVVVPPVALVLCLAGAAAALFWKGPSKSPGLAAAPAASPAAKKQA